MASAFMTRKEVALLLQVSVDQVRKNAIEWGLSRCQQRLNARCIRYRREPAMRALTERKLVKKTETE